MTKEATPPLPDGLVEELLPCPSPWCEAEERAGDFSPAVRLHHHGTYRVVCTSCLIEGPLRNTKAEAIAAWNTRAGGDAELIARQVMADVLGLDVSECDAESRGAQLIREGIRRYQALTQSSGACGAMREALDALPDARTIMGDWINGGGTGNYPELIEYVLRRIRNALQSAPAPGDEVVRLCRERAQGYGALRQSSLTAIALDRAADRLEALQSSPGDECLICGKGRDQHDGGLGLLTCRGIAMPTYRPAALKEQQPSKGEGV